MHLYTAHVLLNCQFSIRIFVKLPASDDVNLKALVCKKETEVTQQLAGRGVVGVKIAINKNALHSPTLPPPQRCYRSSTQKFLHRNPSLFEYGPQRPLGHVAGVIGDGGVTVIDWMVPDLMTTGSLAVNSKPKCLSGLTISR